MDGAGTETPLRSAALETTAVKRKKLVVTKDSTRKEEAHKSCGGPYQFVS
jgi:hypothetical protein